MLTRDLFSGRNLTPAGLTELDTMHRIASFTLSCKASVRTWLALLSCSLMLAGAPAFAADTPAPVGNAAVASSAGLKEPEPIVSKRPVELQADDGGAHGQLPVATEILGTDAGDELIFSITREPLHGRVGLAGGDEGTDFFANKSSNSGYFAYRSVADYAGDDSFGYSVRNQTTGLVFQNTVDITVKPPVLVLQKVEVSGTRQRTMNVHEVSLTTRPNQPVTQKMPSHENFMKPEDRVGLAQPKVAYLLDDKAKPKNGTVKLDPVTGQLTYAPNPGFMGEDQFRYYTVDENN